MLRRSNVDFNEYFDIKSYARYILNEGIYQDKSELIKDLGVSLHLYNGSIYTEPLS